MSSIDQFDDTSAALSRGRREGMATAALAIRPKDDLRVSFISK